VIGSTLPFHLSAGAQTLVFTVAASTSDNRQRLPQKLTVAAPSDSAVAVTVDWYKLLNDDTYTIVDGFSIDAGDTRTADFSSIVLRPGDLLYVTVDVACDVFLLIAEPDLDDD